MKCNNCGKEIDDDSLFCEFCGTKVITNNQSDHNTSIQENGKRIPIWLYPIMVLIAVIIVLIALPKSNKEEIPGTSINEVQEVPIEEVYKEELPIEPDVISLTSIELNKTSLTIEVGKTTTLTVKYNPSNVTDKSTSWKSTDTKVASVNSEGKVTAIKEGVAAIIATCDGKDAYCNVKVTNKVIKTNKQEEVIVVNKEDFIPDNFVPEWIDLGLSVKWATCNLGASSPEDYGNYYAWGEISSKKKYIWANYKYNAGGSDDLIGEFSKYNIDNNRGVVDGRTKLELSDDVAHVKWGGNWRIPTVSDFEELMENCTWEWTTQDGVLGYKVTSNKSGYSGHSIFLPAGGAFIYENKDLVGEWGYYQANRIHPDGSSYNYELSFNKVKYEIERGRRLFGTLVRPVCP